MAWFTRGDVDNVIGTALRAKVCAPQPTGSYSTAMFIAAEGRARRKVRAAYLMAGYATNDSTPTAMQKDHAIAQWILERYGVNVGLEVPESIRDLISMLELVRTGELPGPDATPSTLEGIGGSQFSDATDTGATGSRPSVWDRDDLKGM